MAYTRLHSLMFLAGTITLLVIAMAAQASEIAASTDISQQFVYDSNPLRVSHDAKGIWGSTTTPALTFTAETPRSSITSQTRVAANMFNDSAFNAADLFEDLHLVRKNERWQAGLAAGFAYDTVRSSEITNFAINAPDIRSEKYTLAPELAFHPNARDRLSLTSSVSTTHYDNHAFTDYALYSLTPTYERTLSRHYSASVGLYVQRYDADSTTTSTSDSVGPTLGVKAILTPRLKATLGAGVLATDKQNGTHDQQLTNYVFRGELNYKGIVDALDFTTRRAREPFGNGTETLLTSFSVNEQHRLNPLLSLKVEGKAQIADYESDPGVNLDHSESIGGGLAYTLTPHTELAANYRYRSEKLTTINTPMDQHLVMLSLTYHPFSVD